MRSLEKEIFALLAFLSVRSARVVPAIFSSRARNSTIIPGLSSLILGF
jgi:hypothetical protein